MRPIQTKADRYFNEWSPCEQKIFITVTAITILALTATFTMAFLRNGFFGKKFNYLPVAGCGTITTLLSIQLLVLSILFTRPKTDRSLSETPEPTVGALQQNTHLPPPKTPETEVDVSQKSLVSDRFSPILDVSSNFQEALQKCSTLQQCNTCFIDEVITPYAAIFTNSIKKCLGAVLKVKGELRLREDVFAKIEKVKGEMLVAFQDFLKIPPGTLQESVAFYIKESQREHVSKIIDSTRFEAWKESTHNEGTIDGYKTYLSETTHHTRDIFGFLMFLIVWKQSNLERGLSSQIFETITSCMIGETLPKKFLGFDIESQLKSNFKKKKLARYYPLFACDSFSTLFVNLTYDHFRLIRCLKMNAGAPQAERDFQKAVVATLHKLIGEENFKNRMVLPLIQPSTCHQYDFFSLFCKFADHLDLYQPPGT